MRFWSDRIGLTIETALAPCSARAANLGGFLPVRDFWEAQTGSFKPTPANIVPIPLPKEPTLSGRVY